MPTVLIPGGSGLLGKALSRFLADKGYDIVILTRSTPKPEKNSNSKIRFAQWDTQKQTIDEGVIENADVIINLAGASVSDKRWTEKRKKELIQSRVNAGETIVKALREKPNKVSVVINASGIGWYGDDKESTRQSKGFVETDPHANNFLGTTCQQWEASIEPVKELGKRLVILRTGIVLSKEGGALKEFMMPVKFGVAAILGNGRQIYSWIHVLDFCELVLWVIENKTLSGVYNAVSPFPVSNRNLMRELAHQVKGNFYFPFYVPAFVLRILIGELSVEVLKSATVSCEKLAATGFAFQFPDLKAALKDLCKTPKKT